MSNADPFAPTDPEFNSPKSISIGALIAGLVTDIATSLVLGVGAGIVMAIVIARPGMTPEQFQEELFKNQTFAYLTILLASVGSIIGGFVAAKIAKRAGLMHGILTGALSAALGVALLVGGVEDVTPMWANVVAFSLTIPAAALGGHLGCRSEV